MLDAPLKTLVDPAQRPAAGAIVQDDYDLDCPWHSHDMHQLQYAFDGAIEVEDTHARYLLPRSLAAWIPAGVAHRTSLHRVRSGSILFAADLVQPAGARVRIIEVSALMRETLAAERTLVWHGPRLFRGAGWPLHRMDPPRDVALTSVFARAIASGRYGLHTRTSKRWQCRLRLPGLGSVGTDATPPVSERGRDELG